MLVTASKSEKRLPSYIVCPELNIKGRIHSKVGHNFTESETELGLVLKVVNIYSIYFYWCLLCAWPCKGARVS